MEGGDLRLQSASLRYAFTPQGQAELIDHLLTQDLLDDRRFRSIHPRNTGLANHLAYIKRQAARGKPFRPRGSSHDIHQALLGILIQPDQGARRRGPASAPGLRAEASPAAQRSLVSAWR
ncbi:MAG: hypothetical protein ACKO8I_18975 [Cyanobacteriota bacterium]